MSKTISFRVGSSLLAALAISCGNQSLELSAPPKLEPSTDPTTLGSINEQVGWLTVDDERLYWTGTFAERLSRETGTQTGTALHSCKKDHCSDSLVTYDASNVALVSGFGLHDGQIYWRTVTDVWEGLTAIVACPTTGCVGPPRVLFGNDRSPDPLALGAEGIYLFSWPDQTFLRLPYAGAASRAPVKASQEAILASAVHGDFLYWLGSAAINSARSKLYRTRSDGSSKVEVLASELEVLSNFVAQNTAAMSFLRLGFDETYVYWTQNTLTGALLRCPLAGCSASPEVIAEPIRAPVNLLPDGERAYFQYYDTLLGNSLSSCILAHCEPSAPIAHGLDGWNAITFDDRYVYAATTDQVPNPDQSWDTPSAHIRRFPK